VKDDTTQMYIIQAMICDEYQPETWTPVNTPISATTAITDGRAGIIICHTPL